MWANSPKQLGGSSWFATANSIAMGGLAGHDALDLDPRFVNPSSDDYRLAFDSPAIDAGETSSVPASLVVDLAGEPRVQGDAVDIGAFERD